MGQNKGRGSNHPLRMQEQHNTAVTGDRKRDTGVIQTWDKSSICVDRQGRPYCGDVIQKASARLVPYSAAGSDAQQTGWNDGQGYLRATQKRAGGFEKKD